MQTGTNLKPAQILNLNNTCFKNKRFQKIWKTFATVIDLVAEGVKKGRFGEILYADDSVKQGFLNLFCHFYPWANEPVNVHPSQSATVKTHPKSKINLIKKDFFSPKIRLIKTEMKKIFTSKITDH